MDMKGNFSKIILVLVVSSILGFNITQPAADVFWERSYGGSLGDLGESFQRTSDGGYIIAGVTNLIGGGYEGDILLIKTDADGNEIWSRIFGGPEWEGTGYGTGLQQTTDGGYIIASSTGSFGAGSQDAYLIKTDADGNEIWSKTYGGADYDYACSVRQTPGGGYILVGSTRSFGAGGIDVYLIKTDADGNEVWSRTYGGSGWDRIFGTDALQLTDDGGYIIVGYSNSFSPTGDVYLIKTDSNGNELWSRTFGGSGDDVMTSVKQTTDGGYIMAGNTDSFTTGEARDVYLIKTDTDGNELWSRTFGETMDSEAAASVQQTSDGGYILAGRKTPEVCRDGECGYYRCDADVYLVKTDTNGNEVWSETFIGSHRDWAEMVQQTSDGGYIIVGSMYSETTCYNIEVVDVYLMYYRPNRPPEAICQDVTVSAESGVCSADASVDDGSFDPDGDPITLEQAPPGPYDLGETDVVLTVTDYHGTDDTCNATVTVLDDEAPVISSVTTRPNELWPPNHKMVPVAVVVDALDNCDATCQIISVASNEPVNGLGDGDTAPDWIKTGDLSVKLRAERSGKGVGRTYAITVECADQSGNSVTDTATVIVPRDKGNKKNK